MKDMFPTSLSGSICLDKIDKQYIYEYNGKKYANLRLKFTPDNQFGNDYMITQDVDKDTREQCKSTGQWPQTPILGNLKAWSNNQSRPTQAAAPSPSAPPASNDDNLPF